VSKPDNRKNRNAIIFLRDNASARLERRGLLFSKKATVDLTNISSVEQEHPEIASSILLGPSFLKAGYRTTMFTDTVEHINER